MRTDSSDMRSLVNVVIKVESKKFRTITISMSDHTPSPTMYFKIVFLFIILNPNKDGRNGYAEEHGICRRKKYL